MYFFKTKHIKMHYITGFNSDITGKMLFCNITANERNIKITQNINITIENDMYS